MQMDNGGACKRISLDIGAHHIYEKQPMWWENDMLQNTYALKQTTMWMLHKHCAIIW